MQKRDSYAPNSEGITTLITIPLELREMIFKQIFSSITVRHGFDKRSSHHTSLLQACRQIHNEAKPILAQNISLYFQSTEFMLDCLTKLSSENIHNIRHIRVKSFPFPLYTDQRFRSYTTYNMSDTLPMFPGLQLDRLTVEDCYHDEGVNDGWGDTGTYFDVQSLIESDSWKELHYITPTTEFMSSSNDTYRSRVQQPSGWNELLQARDGAGSGAEVKMYVANVPGVTGLTANPQTRTVYNPIPGHLSTNVQPLPGTMVNDSDSEGDLDTREVLVVAKRGINASYVQDGSQLNEKIRSLLSKMTWQEIKDSGRYLPPEDDPCAHL